jgi:hypothetical protein
MTIKKYFIASILAASLSLGQTTPLPPVIHKDSGDGVTGVFEGWFKTAQGTFLEIGYYNRNLKEPLDIPVGVNNRIEPGGPDWGQPTHFDPKKAWGVSVIRVPDDFGDRELKWTITANGKTTVVPLNLKNDWQLAPFEDAEGDQPAYLSFYPLAQKQATGSGPIPVTLKLTATVGQAVTLPVYVADDAKVQPGQREPRIPVSVQWSVYRQPMSVNSVTFSQIRPVVEKTNDYLPPRTVFTGRATTSVSFSQPGEYVLAVQALDATGEGGGGFMCCWTNGLVQVTVAARPITARVALLRMP